MCSSDSYFGYSSCVFTPLAISAQRKPRFAPWPVQVWSKETCLGGGEKSRVQWFVEEG